MSPGPATAGAVPRGLGGAQALICCIYGGWGRPRLMGRLLGGSVPEPIVFISEPRAGKG